MIVGTTVPTMIAGAIISLAAVPTVIVGTTVPTMIVGTTTSLAAVPTIIVETTVLATMGEYKCMLEKLF